MLLPSLSAWSISASRSSLTLSSTPLTSHPVPFSRVCLSYLRFSAVIITSATSCGNSFVYVATRSIHSLAVNGQAPKVLSYTTKRGVPLFSLLFVLGICCLSYMSTFFLRCLSPLHCFPRPCIRDRQSFRPITYQLVSRHSCELRCCCRLRLVPRPLLCRGSYQLLLDVPCLDPL